MRYIIFTVFLALMLSNTQVIAQEIEADVTVSLEQVEQDNRYHATTMESDLERYINSQSFTDAEWEGPPIPVKLNIFLSGGANGIYSAKLFVASQRYLYGQGESVTVTIKLIENGWAFEYARGAMLSYNPDRFDRLASLIDFYMLLVIGFDLDTYEVHGGTRAFEKAKYIVQLGAGKNVEGYSTFYQPGEYTKYALVSELTDLRYEPLRALIFEYYVDGLDYMVEDEEAAIKNLEFIIRDIAIFKQDKMVGPSTLLFVWFNTKADEIAETFKGRMSAQLYQDLTYLDPTNTQIYLDAYEATR